MTTQEQEFNKQIDRIGELYESLKEAFYGVQFGLGTKSDFYGQLAELRDIACMTVKNIHQPIYN